MRHVLLVLALAMGAALAGCFSDEPVPASRTVQASGGKLSEGWAYDGAGLADATATLEGTLDHTTDAGLVTVTFRLGGSDYVATFDAFAETKPFMQGGVAFNLDEHGETQVGDASIPRIHALVAAWGAATLTKDGEPLTGSAGDRWTAHLMVSRDTVRGPDGKILNQAGTAPYDPARPEDARRVENDAQAFFFVKHPDGETFRRAAATGSAPLTIAGPDAVQTTSIPAEKGVASATVNVTVTAAQAPVAAGTIAVRILDAEGNEVHVEPEANVLPNQGYARSIALTPELVTGPLTVEVRGAGAYTATIDHVVTYEDHPFVVLTWDEVTLA